MMLRAGGWVTTAARENGTHHHRMSVRVCVPYAAFTESMETIKLKQSTIHSVE